MNSMGLVVKLGAHQPNFLPWLGFFDKMLKADIFVIVDHIQYERQGYQNRTQIKTGEGPRWIIVPVRQASRDELVIDKHLDNTGHGCHHWAHRVSKTIECAYRGAPYYTEYVVPITEVLNANWDRLVDLNIKLIEVCNQALNIKTQILRSSELMVQGNKSDMVLSLCHAVGAKTYLSGSGGSKKYLNCSSFASAGVTVEWQDFIHPVYPQHPAGKVFIEGMSVIDLLANCGPNSRTFLEKRLAFNAKEISP